MKKCMDFPRFPLLKQWHRYEYWWLVLNYVSHLHLLPHHQSPLLNLHIVHMNTILFRQKYYNFLQALLSKMDFQLLNNYLDLSVDNYILHQRFLHIDFLIISSITKNTILTFENKNGAVEKLSDWFLDGTKRNSIENKFSISSLGIPHGIPFLFWLDHISEGRPRTIFFILLIMLSLTLLIPLVKYFYSHCNPFLSSSYKLDKCILFFHNLSWWHLYIHIHYKFDYLDSR